jgi:hypothetical protein
MIKMKVCRNFSMVEKSRYLVTVEVSLSRYLAEPTFKVSKLNQYAFDILAWWKNQQDEYPILSKLVRDVLAMQASTVASESAFSTGGRAVDPYRSRLDPEIVEVLVCTRDWILAAKKGKQSK